MPWIISALISKAQVVSPGIPRAIIGMMAPPTEALFAISGAIIPSTHPVPNFSGCFERAFATAYATTFESPAPIPGINPIAKPRA